MSSRRFVALLLAVLQLGIPTFAHARTRGGPGADAICSSVGHGSHRKPALPVEGAPSHCSACAHCTPPAIASASAAVPLVAARAIAPAAIVAVDMPGNALAQPNARAPPWRIAATT